MSGVPLARCAGGSAVVAAEHPLAALAGYRVLLRGGNAVDAAVAVSFTLAVVLPHLGGLGGDFFALAGRVDGGDVVFVDGSGPAPAGLSRELLASKGYSSMPVEGPLAVNVPGMVDGLYTLWRRMGRLDWAELVLEAVELAERGFTVPPSLASTLRRVCSSPSDPGLARTFCTVEPGIDVRLRLPGLAKALRAIADDPRSFYEGPIAEKLAGYVRGRGGVLGYEDLASYHASAGKPLEASYKGWRLLEMPPPTQGLTTIHILKLLEDTSPTAGGPTGAGRVVAHLQAYIPAYWARDSYITDPRYMSVEVDWLLSGEFIAKLKSMRGKLAAGGLRGGGGDTTFFTVVDGDGLAVAGIQSLFHPFGSKLVEPEYQIPLNNRASSFSLNPSHANRLEPGKKTLHTLSALALKSPGGEAYIVGLSGGHYRPQLHSIIATNIIDYHMSLQEALDTPRFTWTPGTNTLQLEEGVEEPQLQGYRVKRLPHPARMGVAAAAKTAGGLKLACSDVRGDGVALSIP